MLNTLIGTKGEMSQAFVEGRRHPVTRVKVGPCVVTMIKKMEKDGYWAVQLGMGEKRLKNTTKPLQGHFKNVIKDSKAPRFVREVRVTEEPNYKVGDQIKVSDIFLAGDTVTVSGVSKGKGFAGGVKRWKFAGGPKTHGQSDRQRAPGSIGQGTTPGRVLKGKHMAGRMGSETKSTSGLTVLSVDPENNELMISSPIPGNVDALVVIKKTAGGDPTVAVSEPEIVETPAEVVEETVEEPKTEVETSEAEVKEEKTIEEVKEAENA